MLVEVPQGKLRNHGPLLLSLPCESLVWEGRSVEGLRDLGRKAGFYWYDSEAAFRSGEQQVYSGQCLFSFQNFTFRCPLAPTYAPAARCHYNL